MNLTRHPEKFSLPTSARAAPPDRRATVEDRNFYASSRDLAQGLVVQELDESIPVELMQLT